MISKPPMPLPMITPTRAAFSGPIASPLSPMAIDVHARANWMKRAHFFTSFLSSHCSGSKPFTSPANRVECRPASK